MEKRVFEKSRQILSSMCLLQLPESRLEACTTSVNLALAGLFKHPLRIGFGAMRAYYRYVGHSCVDHCQVGSLPRSDCSFSNISVQPRSSSSTRESSGFRSSGYLSSIAWLLA